jgi:hypothetical protein
MAMAMYMAFANHVNSSTARYSAPRQKILRIFLATDVPCAQNRHSHRADENSVSESSQKHLWTLCPPNK